MKEPRYLSRIRIVMLSEAIYWGYRSDFLTESLSTSILCVSEQRRFVRVCTKTFTKMQSDQHNLPNIHMHHHPNTTQILLKES